MQKQSEEVKSWLQIIARYDEVISTKAQKHSLVELRTEIFKRFDELLNKVSYAGPLISEIQSQQDLISRNQTLIASEFRKIDLRDQMPEI